MQSNINGEDRPGTHAKGAVAPVPAATPPTPVRPRRRWRRRLVVGVLLALIVIFHAPLLTFLGGLLVVDDPLEPVDAVVVMGAAGQHVPFAELADLYQKGLARQIVLIEDRSSRIVAAGIIPPLEPLVRRELAARAVPDTALTVRAGPFRTGWHAARNLRGWMDEHPGARVIVLCDQIGSRETAHVFASVLGPPAAGRVLWHAVPDRRYDTTNWWRVRQGILLVFGHYVSLGHTYAFGEPEEPVRRWDPDRFEQELRRPEHPKEKE